MKIRRRALWSFGVILALLAGWVALSLHLMARKDAEHARFHAIGSSINSFLGDYCGAIELAFSRGDVAPVLALYSEGYASPDRGSWTWLETTREPEVSMQSRTAAGHQQFGRSDLERELAQYLADLTAIDRTICKIDLIEEIQGIEETRASSVVLTVKHILDGEGEGNLSLQDRVFFRWHLVNEGGADPPHEWRILRDELVDGIRVVGSGQALADIDPRSLGIDFAHQRDPRLDKKRHAAELMFAVIEHASGGLSAADYDLDGRPDLFFLDGLEARLYHNEGLDAGGRPRFIDVTAAAGLDGIDQAHVALFADFDNDGDRDLFVGRYLAPSLYYRNRGDGTFEDTSGATGVAALVEPVTSATLLDYDRDGFVDIYAGINGNPFEALPRLPFFARNGHSNRLLRNVGGERFVDVTIESDTGDTGWTLAVAAGDYDDDGLSDLAVANDFGRKRLYRNNGDGSFTDMAKAAGVLDFGGGMGVVFGDYDGDGRADLYTSNINSNQRWFGEDMTIAQYVRNVMRTRWFLADFGEYMDLYRLVGDRWTELGQQVGEGNSLFHNKGDGTFEEMHDSQAVRAGWGWGVAFLDLENDTDLDIYAANGWISNTPDTDL